MITSRVDLAMSESIEVFTLTLPMVHYGITFRSVRRDSSLFTLPPLESGAYHAQLSADFLCCSPLQGLWVCWIGGWCALAVKVLVWERAGVWLQQQFSLRLSALGDFLFHSPDISFPQRTSCKAVSCMRHSRIPICMRLCVRFF